MKTLTSIAAAAALVAVVGGCNSTKDVSYSHITGHLTPELKGLSERPTDDHTAFATASNTNLRMMWDDIGRVLYLDQPTHLSPSPIMSTSGQGW